MPLKALEYGQNNRFDHILRRGGPGGRRLSAASAEVREGVAAVSDHERAIRDVAAGVAAPLLVSYVVWVLFNARARGIKRLYFLSRDGEVLLELADILAPRLGITVERRYLYASRKGWNCDPVTTAAVPPEQARLLHAYLEQEGLFDSVPKALVDLGGRGSQLARLCELMPTDGVEPCPLYLFWGTPYASPWIRLRHCFYFDGGDGTVQKQHDGPRDLDVPMEAFSISAAAPLNGFRRNGNRIDPQFGRSQAGEIVRWGLPLLRKTLATAAHSIDLDGLKTDEIDPAANRAFEDMLARLLNAFWETPTVEEARAWARLPSDKGPIAEPYDPRDILCLLQRKAFQKHRYGFWVKGALALTPPALGTVVQGLWTIRRIAANTVDAIGTMVAGTKKTRAATARGASTGSQSVHPDNG